MRFKMFALVAPAAALSLFATPAAALVGAGGGVVEGAVTVTPGVPTSPTAPANSNTVSFDSFAIVGAMANVGPNAAYAGLIACTASGSGSDTAALGTGTVSVGCTGSNATGTFGATLSGSYTRHVAVVTVDLDGTCTINGNGVTCHIHVAALFGGVPSGGVIHNAQFAGVFVGDTVA